jgi:hypothetical protein
MNPTKGAGNQPKFDRRLGSSSKLNSFFAERSLGQCAKCSAAGLSKSIP